jgi:hypothetical protein
LAFFHHLLDGAHRRKIFVGDPEDCKPALRRLLAQAGRRHPAMRKGEGRGVRQAERRVELGDHGLAPPSERAAAGQRRLMPDEKEGPEISKISKNSSPALSHTWSRRVARMYKKKKKNIFFFVYMFPKGLVCAGMRERATC